MTGRRFFPAAFLVLLGAAAACPSGAHAAPELKKLYVLIAVDTVNIPQDCAVDRDNLRKLLAAGIPSDRYQVTVLEGKGMNRRNILDYYRRLRVGKDDGLVFLFSGHGAVNQGDGEHYLQVQAEQGGKVEALARRDVRETMRGMGAGLVVLFTDACSDVLDLGRPAAPPPGAHAPLVRVAPGYRRLLFEARGVVDVNGSTYGSSGWSTPETGGWFTRSLLDCFGAVAEDERATWPDFLARLSVRTHETFVMGKQKLLQEARRPLDEEMKRLDKQPTQRPQAYFLPDCRMGLEVLERKDRKGALPDGRGVWVRNTLQGSPAERAGLKRGEVIVRIDGRDVRNVDDFDRAMFGVQDRSGVEVKLTVVGLDGKQREQAVPLVP